MDLCNAVFSVVMNTGHIRDVESLLLGGSDVNLQNDTGDTPIMIAAKWYNVELCTLLLKYNPTLDTMVYGKSAYLIMKKSDILRPIMYKYILNRTCPQLPRNITDLILDIIQNSLTYRHINNTSSRK